MSRPKIQDRETKSISLSLRLTKSQYEKLLAEGLGSPQHGLEELLAKLPSVKPRKKK